MKNIIFFLAFFLGWTTLAMEYPDKITVGYVERKCSVTRVSQQDINATLFRIEDRTAMEETGQHTGVIEHQNALYDVDFPPAWQTDLTGQFKRR